MDRYYIRIIEPLLNDNTGLILNFFFEKGLIPNQGICQACNCMTKLVDYKRSVDKKAWRCLNKNCLFYKKYYSIRDNSFFSCFNADLKTCLKILWKWANDYTQVQISREISYKGNFLFKFIKKIQGNCEKYFEVNRVLLGGPGIVCQIDESLFRYRPKNHRGRAPENELWVFGIADTSYKPSKVFLKSVANRSAHILLPLINEHCRPGTIIYSDEWRAYNNIDINFNHQTVNHSLHFVDPLNFTHTQNIESYWAKVKRRIKNMKGIYGSCLNYYLSEWMFKDMILRDDFENIFDLIRNYN